jgi:hypothetical protein
MAKLSDITKAKWREQTRETDESPDVRKEWRFLPAKKSLLKAALKTVEW